jgi:hypothetical protein
LVLLGCCLCLGHFSFVSIFFQVGSFVRCNPGIDEAKGKCRN